MTANYEMVLDAGPGTPWIVMVHGMSQDHRVFSAQVDTFKDRYRILLIDLPGHGLSSDIGGPFGHSELASHVGGAMEAAGVPSCIYWATHTGTSLGLLLAAETPERFQSLILEGTVLPGHAMASVDRVFAHVRGIAQSEGVPEARRYWFDEAVWFDVMRRHPDECRAAEHRAIVSEISGAPWLYDGKAAAVAPIDDELANLDLPILLYNGEHDIQDFVEPADFLEARLPRVTRTKILEAGAFPAWEFPGRVNQLVADFLSKALTATSTP